MILRTVTHSPAGRRGGGGYCSLYAAPSSLERCMPWQVIIAEPFLKIMTSGDRGIRVDNPAEIQIFLPGVKPLPELHRSIAAKSYGASGASSSAANTPQRDAKMSRDLFEDPYVPGQRVKLIGFTSKKRLRLNGKFGVVAAEQDEDGFRAHHSSS